MKCAFWREGDKTMRQILFAVMAVAAAGVAGVATSAPAAAQQDSWCVQGRDEGIPGDCSYSSYAQCMASASGRNAYCGVNPMAAYARQYPPRQTRRGRPFDPYAYYR
jgi:hypothetical protein